MTLVSSENSDATEVIESFFKMNIDNDALTNFMEKMQMNVEKISKDIKKSNEKLGKEIKESREELREEMKHLNNKIDEVKMKTDGLKGDVENVKKASEDRFTRMEMRLDQVEKEKEKQVIQKRKRDELMEKVENVDIQLVGSAVKSYADKLKASKEVPEATQEVQFKSTWAHMMSQVSLEDQLKKANEAANRMEGEKEEYRRGRSIKKRYLKLGNSQELHGEKDWSWTETEEDWDGVIDKEGENKKKKEKEKARWKQKIEKAALIGQCTIGIGPIKEQSYDYFYKITGDYDESKKMAAAEFLAAYLKFDTDDMSDLHITDTKKSAKGDEILYVVFDSPEKVRNVRRRLADCRNPKIKTRDFIPPPLL